MPVVGTNIPQPVQHPGAAPPHGRPPLWGGGSGTPCWGTASRGAACQGFCPAHSSHGGKAYESRLGTAGRRCRRYAGAAAAGTGLERHPAGHRSAGGTTSDPTPQQSNILPGTDREEPEEPPADTFSVLPSFRILDETTGQVAEIPAADYVAGAIAAEMPASYEEDALIAQGMAAYTNAHYLAALRRADPPEELNGARFFSRSLQAAGLYHR